MTVFVGMSCVAFTVNKGNYCSEQQQPTTSNSKEGAK